MLSQVYQVQQLLVRMLHQAYRLASDTLSKSAKKQKHYYDKKVRCENLEIGDMVLVRNIGLKRKNKLANWISL